MLPGWTRDLALYGAIAAAPDLDLLVGSHSTYTHSVGAVVVAFVATLIVGGGRLRTALAVAAAWGSHLLLDWLGSDTSPPIGIMALWPLTTEHYQSSLHVFEAISRRYWMGSVFVVQNVRAVAREIAILGPIAALAFAWSSWRRSSLNTDGDRRR